ncbi:MULTISPECIES: LysR family transcriptional regulator [unclassified Herbaspirillum]|uniref:LysR family transcriptional regulator n=1 Tax=unclassified Herbaspirillum TaxID=2624150 RepID=UPI00114F85CA|nr:MULTISPECIES: LysR family transcriptional regulator [unclassified Herbaspirillum]MBB5391504.1 DNA-binding transcriptional LysR family regulator [Herbaspirillum sp. SJZ102]TQK12812.1 DNA-binding transcriptional LysR family regulator [Herbaspirillum sp. SJZ130]TQK14816.1 DNA-binding transcriptional LysR family regulator [Herbaspirillum sp. SJZ106]TWC71067.1 DNA-binding transcriptional LysR family regulator [Herbaspirillum sp. SJZ099]
MSNFDWDNFRIFLAAARTQSGVEAAHLLKMSQSTISRRIRQLEKDVGSKLFDRSAQGLRLTTAGHHLFEHAEKLESTFSVMESQAAGGDRMELSGEIRIGATEAFGTFFLMPHLSNFCQRHPGIAMDVLPLPRSLNISKREVDTSVALDRPRANSFVTRKLGEYRLLPYATPEYLARHPRIRRTEDFQDHLWIDFVDDLLFSPQQFHLHKWGASLKRCLRSTSVVAQAQAVKAGLGLAILPCFLANVTDNLVPVLPHKVDITRSLWLVAPPERRELARIRALWDYTREVAEANAGYLDGKTAQMTWLK